MSLTRLAHKNRRLMRFRLAIARQGSDLPNEPHGVREELARTRLVAEDTTRLQDSADLLDRLLRARDVIPSPKVDHEIELALRKGQRANVAQDEFHLDTSLAAVAFGIGQCLAVNTSPFRCPGRFYHVDLG
ncbi:MAG: hypothetical protein WD904_06350 [Dehalococcoidia bacterium]